MKLDKNIHSGKRPLSVLDVEQAAEFINQTCYLSDDLVDFENLNTGDCVVRKLQHVRDCVEYPFSDLESKSYRFCLPWKWVAHEITVSDLRKALSIIENDGHGQLPIRICDVVGAMHSASADISIEKQKIDDVFINFCCLKIAEIDKS